jgi:hypothetical protein
MDLLCVSPAVMIVASALGAAIYRWAVQPAMEGLGGADRGA